MIDPDLPVFAETADLDSVQEQLLAAGLGDGLPLVPPTERRLAAMLTGIDAPAASLGTMPPLFGEVTPAAVAYNATLAGCRPAELPVVLTAALACLEPELNLLGVATTTGSAAVALIVNGPIARTLVMNAAGNALGPGNRANACIGRALALVLRNVGGARPREGDMATLGQPGKYTLCFAEADDSPLPSLAVRRGFAAAASAVTVMAISGTAEVLPAREGDSAEAILAPIAAAMRAAFDANGARNQPEPSEHVWLLPPELANALVSRGWDLARMQGYLFAALRAGGLAAVARPGDIHPIVTGGPGVKMAHLPLWGGGTHMVTRASM